MTNQRRSRVKDMVAAHPLVDWLLIVPLSACWLAWGERLEMSDSSRAAFLGGVATLAALVLAASTFICTLTYQSTSEHVMHVRTRFGRELGRNWVAIFASVLAAAAVALLAFLVLDSNASLATLAGFVALATVLVRASRAQYWLSYTLFLHRVSDASPKPYAVVIPEERNSA